MRTIKEIERMQSRDNVRYEVAKKMANLLTEAKVDWKALGGDSESWLDEVEQIQELVFGDE